MTAPASVPRALLHLNVNGLRGGPKRRELFAALLRGPWDAVVLVETHCASDEEAHAWLREGAGHGMPWQGRAFWSHGTAAAQIRSE